MSGEACKESLRNTLLSARRSRSTENKTASAAAIAAHAQGMSVLRHSTRVAVYLNSPTEPGTGELISLLSSWGSEVIAPRSRADRTMEWALVGDGVLTGPLGMPEPAGLALNEPDPLAACELVFVPALAVDHSGHRLGRGAGYYDRALAAYTGVTCAIVYTEELLDEVPHEDHDVPVQLALTPGGVFRVP